MNDQSDSRKKWPTVLAVALLLSCTLALFGPTQLFLANSLEFNFGFAQVLPLLAAAAFAIFLAVSLLLLPLPRRFRLHERGVALALVLGILLWLQGNLLVWRYGLLNGHEIEWGKKLLFGLIDTPIWAVGLLLAVAFPLFFYRRARALALLLLTVQLLSTSYAVIRQAGLASFQKYDIDMAKEFDFSRNRNVIVLVLDSFQSDILQEIIDRDPSYAGLLKDFTYFRNTLGGFPSTYAAVPFFMTGQYYTNVQPIQQFIAGAYLSPSSIPYQLRNQGWEVDFFPLVRKSVYFDAKVVSNIRAKKQRVDKGKLAHLYDITLFRYLPHLLKRRVYNNEEWLLTRWAEKERRVEASADARARERAKNKAREAFFKSRQARRSLPANSPSRQLMARIPERTIRRNPDARFLSRFQETAMVETETNIFKYYHWRGPHEPIRMNANLEPVNLPLKREHLVDLARGELKLVHIFFEGLREMGIYENALIFVIGDHGHPWGGYGLLLPEFMPGTRLGRDEIPKGVLESGIPLLLVKRPGDRGPLAINEAPASLADISATIFDVLGMAASDVGEPLFGIAADRPRPRRFLYYNWDHSVWMQRYLPDLVEYQVEGHSWLASSWRATGKVFQPGR